MLNLNKALIVRTIKLVGKLAGASETTLEWVTHYALGSQEDKALPDELYEMSYNRVFRDLCSEIDLKGSGFLKGWGKSLTARLCEDELGYPEGAAWWKDTGWSVVGQFNYKVIIDYEEELIGVLCQDDWDFNASDDVLAAPVPAVMQKAVTKILNSLKIEHTFKDGKVQIVEKALEKFNAKHRFSTKWKHLYNFDQFRQFGANPEDIVVKGNGSYIVKRNK